MATYILSNSGADVLNNCLVVERSKPDDCSSGTNECIQGSSLSEVDFFLALWRLSFACSNFLFVFAKLSINE